MFQYKEVRNPIFKYVAWSGIAIFTLAPFVFIGFMAWAFNSGMSGSGEYNIISLTPSPDRKNVAIVYAGWGGGAAGWSFLLTTVHPAAEPFNPELDVSEYRYILDIKGGSEITPIWEGNDNLLITYTYKPTKTSTYFKVAKETKSKHTGVKMRYIEKYIEAVE
jgi:hypothetical protein